MIIKKSICVLLISFMIFQFLSCENEKPVPKEIKKPPVSKEIPQQTVDEGGSFKDLKLRDFISDEYYPFDKLTFSAASGKNIHAKIMPKGIVSFSAFDIKWSGKDTLSLTAVNPDGLSITIPVLLEVNPVNDPPVIGSIPDQHIMEGEVFSEINLSGYVSDIDNTDSEIQWSCKGFKELKAEILNNKLFVRQPNSEWYGTEKLILSARDQQGGSVSRQILFSVNPVNDPPLVTAIPAQLIAEGSIFPELNLSDYISDIDNNFAQLLFTLPKKSVLKVNLYNGRLKVEPPDNDWYGSEIIHLVVSDPGGSSVKAALQFIVEPVNDPPVLLEIPEQKIKEGESFSIINLENHVSDIDDNNNELQWEAEGSSNLSVKIDKNILTAIPFDEDWYGSDTLKLEVSDKEGLSSETHIIFTVEEVPFYEFWPYKNLKNIGITAVNDVYELATSPLRWDSDDIVTFGLIFSGTIMLTGVDEIVRKEAVKHKEYSTTKLMEAAEYYGRGITSQITALALGTYGIVMSDDEVLRIGLEVFEAYFISNSVQSVLKRFIGRSRPEKGDGGFEYDPFPNIKVQEKSMPSGHTILAFTLSSVLAAHTDSPYLKAAIFTPAFLTAAQRIYGDKHWLSDVFLGAALGYFIGDFIVRRHDKGTEDNLFFTLDQSGRLGIGYRF